MMVILWPGVVVLVVMTWWQRVMGRGVVGRLWWRQSRPRPAHTDNDWARRVVWLAGGEEEAVTGVGRGRGGVVTLHSPAQPPPTVPGQP